MLRLQPTIEDASRDYVLVQAWKKASSYIRYHNWFSDTLELDYQTANLPDFLESISREMRLGDWVSDPLRLVLAPKSQEWQTPVGRGLWKPRKRREPAKLRPLAHVSLRDQVASTALMLCLADRAETAQGDPRVPTFEDGTRRSMVSYGNRLYCDNDGDGNLTHRWGSSKLYRSFSEDYRRFVERPELVAKDLIGDDQNVVVIQSDLSQFYDRVRPELLMDKLHGLVSEHAGPGFLRLVSQVMNWRWHDADADAADEYAGSNKIDGFDRICLPQGLVSSGFFANVALLDFDRRLVAQRERLIGDGILLHDSCRYVDDLRLVVTTPPDMDTEAVELLAFETLGTMLGESAPGLLPSQDKTEAANFRGEVRPLLRQSRKMERIQYAVSGGFDIARGEEIIDAVQSLVRAQQHYSRNLPENKDRASRNGRDKRLPVPDVKDATVARFAAARFRTTYRSLRPLLFGAEDDLGLELDEIGDGHVGGLEITKADLDEEAHNFALNLIQNWIDDPSNVRLLRIGLDIWPSLTELEDVLALLRPYALARWDSREKRTAAYCLSEIFKAGATETGFVKDHESLPDSVDVAGYRKRLAEEASLVLAKATTATPWYLTQQALLLVTVTNRTLDRKISRRIAGSSADVGTQRYVRFIRFLEGDFTGLSVSGFANFAIMARRSILNAPEAQRLVGSEMDGEILAEIAKRDPGFAIELSPRQTDVKNVEDTDLFGEPQVPLDGRWFALSVIGKGGAQLPNLRHEVGVTSLLSALARWRLERELPASLPPSSIEVQVVTEGGHDRVSAVRIAPPTLFDDDTIERLYQPPGWCLDRERWRFQMGYLVRFILTGNLDFTAVARTSWRELEPIYRPVRSHWYQRLYGLNNAMEGFGDDWLPISEKTEELLYSMLAWPGCRDLDMWWLDLDKHGVAKLLAAKLAEALACIGKGTETLLLKIRAPLFVNPLERSLRGCVVQTIRPHQFDPPDLSVSGSAIRKSHRKHLSTALAAVEKMLDLRATHSGDGNLDWLILPELSVHPEDIEKHLVPFARRHRTIVLAGITYEQLSSGAPLVNSAMWILPHFTPGRGLQMKRRRQGKQHLAAKELVWEAAGLVQSFRPCQWLVGYVWDANPEEKPLWLSAAVCYDATDLGLASDLRMLSDVFAIPALNQDVGTFDQMAAALHYHMYQMVIVANNGSYGGSNAHIPKKEHYHKQVFHTHGQPQASISFFEIDEIRDMKNRHKLGKIPPPVTKPAPGGTWKYPPAGS